MNQEKIGKFIAELRKQKKLTQEQLAEKLGITKNAVSKWERGLGLMDLSLLKPLSEILNVSVTEILNGEKFDKEEINSKSEELLIDTLDYSTNVIKKVKKNKVLIILLTISITILSIILLDTIQAIAFKNSPIISWRFEDANDSDSYVDKGILIDTYYCVKEQDIITVIPTFKNTNYNCPSE
ncbi:MAG: helix-turn-helix transcriptional regulator [Firmicutes bacterium]|nr:helix-turn-helix transcriptional regulator [Bacillota bacterium]